MSTFIRNFPISKIRTVGSLSLRTPVLLKEVPPFDVLDAIWINNLYELTSGYYLIQEAEAAGKDEVVACIHEMTPPKYYEVVATEGPPAQIDSLADGELD